MRIITIEKLGTRSPNIKVSGRFGAPNKRIEVGFGDHPSLTIIFESVDELMKRGARCDDKRVIDALIASGLGFMPVVSKGGCKEVLPDRKRKLRFTEGGKILFKQPGSG